MRVQCSTQQIHFSIKRLYSIRLGKQGCSQRNKTQLFSNDFSTDVRTDRKADQSDYSVSTLSGHAYYLKMLFITFYANEIVVENLRISPREGPSHVSVLVRQLAKSLANLFLLQGFQCVSLRTSFSISLY